MRARGCKLRMNHRNFLGSSNLLPNQCPAIVISAGAPARPAQQSTPLGRPPQKPACTLQRTMQRSCFRFEASTVLFASLPQVAQLLRNPIPPSLVRARRTLLREVALLTLECANAMSNGRNSTCCYDTTQWGRKISQSERPLRMQKRKNCDRESHNGHEKRARTAPTNAHLPPPKTPLNPKTDLG